MGGTRVSFEIRNLCEKVLFMRFLIQSGLAMDPLFFVEEKLGEAFCSLFLGRSPAEELGRENAAILSTLVLDGAL